MPSVRSRTRRSRSSFSRRSSSTASRRSVTSRELITMPRTAGSSSRFVATACSQCQPPSRVRTRNFGLHGVSLGLENLAEQLPHRGQVVGMGEIEGVAAHEVAGVEPQRAIGGRIFVGDRPLGVDDGDVFAPLFRQGRNRRSFCTSAASASCVEVTSTSTIR